ncbi:hypothetical protein H2200_005315 [Cladophialophora chaetospira]|uniref:DNA2/NAM7 helicase helicase domain-containing protein n=1 Tax=Cladophialophora chaetospira TaxID=386627 RepID=A0AA38XBR5_9EURO|nr:hypothetical protein H2200_005315 [Cladophialophora chaetospira]
MKDGRDTPHPQFYDQPGRKHGRMPAVMSGAGVNRRPTESLGPQYDLANGSPCDEFYHLEVTVAFNSSRWSSGSTPGDAEGPNHLTLQEQNSSQQTTNELETKFCNWKYFIPKSIHSVPLTPLPPLFFEHALEFLQSEIGVMQEAIVTLASEGGLQRIKQVVDRNLETMGPQQRNRVIQEQAIPLCRVIVHVDVLASTVLDTHLGTIYNFIYGAQGQRAVAFFKPVFAVLADRDQAFISVLDIEAVIAAFSKVIDCNTHAWVNDELKLIADSIYDTVALLGDDEAHESRKLLQRISRRMQLAREIPGWTAPKRNVPRTATFTLQCDLPGALSKDGPRHNNDHTNACNIQIMPTFEEIRAVRPEYLPSMNQDDWHLDGVAGLLDRHFRLLREDTVGQLRDAVREEIDSPATNEKAARRQNIRRLTYNNARVVHTDFNSWQGILLTIGFDQPTHLREYSTKLRKEWWESQKRLRIDSLLCLLSSHGSLLFCSVIEPRKPDLHSPSKRTDLLDPGDHSADSETESHRDLFTNALHAFVTISVTTENANEALTFIRMSSAASDVKIVEFPGVLLPSFEPTLRALQKMLRSPELPFSEYLAAEPHVDIPVIAPPHYATKPGFRFDLSSIMKEKEPLWMAVDDTSDYTAFRDNSLLDPAQADALLNSLNRSIALIQGPPGTGKSFTGVGLIKVLLAAQSTAKLGPILCVCYTNHALDQLLEDLISHDIGQIVRMGSQSKSEVLQNCNLRVLARNIDLTKVEKRERWDAKSELVLDEKVISRAIKQFAGEDEVTSLRSYLELYHPVAHQAFFGDVDEDGFQRVVYHEMNLLKAWLQQGGRQNGNLRDLETLAELPTESLSHAERHLLYDHWLTESEMIARSELLNALSAHAEHKERFDQIRTGLDLRCLQQAKIIGVTTTGLARALPLLEKLNSKVLICEEAGEVLEAHILTALLPALEHVILIGDHLQLPPKCANYDLSRESSVGKKYSLDVSLFERLVTPSCSTQTAVPYSTLETQRRMHPCVSELIRRTLYPRLCDSPVVQEYPPVA